MGMSVTISGATEEDAEQVFRLRYLCFQSEAARYGNYRIDPLVQSLESLRAEVAAGAVLVARLGDEVVGSAHAAIGSDHAGEIAKLCVHPRLQGHGLGARLLLAAERLLSAEHDTKQFRLFTGHRSESNLRLYRKAGYTAVGERTGGDGVRLILLEKGAPSASYVASA
ncbi:GNAT family N-acetyltransferase [Streptomyces sp. NPDC060194]|uniref:GNAT family N-acetyltransferase n=1 Tax=Streptomyces sp. NPDC060194 TaxID=3347069 RepID=UPI00364ABE10